MKLIMNGDDFGITRGVNAAMIDCFSKGYLSSTSMMVNMPAAKEASELMKACPKLSVGIHLNLTVGKPLTDCPSLVKADGTFNKNMLKDSSMVDVKEMECELRAQMERFIALTGQKPTHINSHHGIEQIRGAEAIVCQLSREYDLPVRRFFTLPSGNHPDVDYVIPEAKLFFDFNSFATPEKVIELFSKEDLESDRIYEYACHPGYVDYEILQISSLTTGRVYDAHVFMSEKIGQWIQDHQIEMVGYEALTKK